MQSKRKAWSLTCLLTGLLLPATAQAHGMQGLGALIAGVFIAAPFAGIMLIFIIILIAFLVGRKDSRPVRIFARVVQGLAIAFQVLFMLFSFLIEHNDEGLTIGGAFAGGLLLFTGTAFILAQIQARRCLQAKAFQAQAFQAE